MFQIDYEKKVKKKTVDGPGFSFKIPKTFSSRNENDPQGKWGYGEFFQTNTFEGRYEPQTNMFFFYWKVTKEELSGKQAGELIEAVCKEKIFSGEYSIELLEISPIIFKRYPAFILKYLFSHQNPKAEGKIRFFVINNISQKRIYILGTLIEAVGSNIIENETMAWLEDQIINSFRFKKNIGG